MQVAKLFKNSRSQAVRLPKEYKFKGSDVFIQKHDDAVILFFHEKRWKVFLDGLHSFSSDIFKEGRTQSQNQMRGSL